MCVSRQFQVPPWCLLLPALSRRKHTSPSCPSADTRHFCSSLLGRVPVPQAPPAAGASGKCGWKRERAHRGAIWESRAGSPDSPLCHALSSSRVLASAPLCKGTAGRCTTRARRVEDGGRQPVVVSARGVGAPHRDQPRRAGTAIPHPQSCQRRAALSGEAGCDPVPFPPREAQGSS